MKITTQPHPFDSSDFRRFFIARTLAETGTETASLAIPLLAVLTLDASPGQVGLLGALTTAAYLIIGLPAGVWVDRFSRRWVLVVSQLVHGGILLSIPISWILGILTLNQVYVCVLLAGATSVFSRIAQQTYLPDLVSKEGLLAANSSLAGMGSTAMLAGRGAGGYLVQFLGAPFVILGNAAAEIVSGVLTATIRKAETPPEATERRSIFREIGEGLRYVFDHSVLRTLALSSLVLNLGINALIVMLPVLIVTDLSMSEGRAGLFFMIGAAGVLLGSMAANKVSQLLGRKRCLALSCGLAGAATLVTPLLSDGVIFWGIAFTWAISQFGFGVYNVINITLRQELTEPRMLGRMTATMRFLMTGALTLSALWAGGLAELQGVRSTLLVGAIITTFAWVPLAFTRMSTVNDTY